MEAVVAGPPKQLIESVADDICKRVLLEQPRASAVQLYIRKLCIPGLPSDVESVGMDYDIQ